ncbi:MAG: TonB-dependent receptor [Bacteroidales bacterium]|nr:TonB-dependent receptor [Bacteroidales bacterium]
MPQVQIYGQQKTDANVIGHIIDANSGEHIPFAFVSFPDLNMGAQSDDSGHYMVTNLPEGRHKVVVSFMGYNNYTTYVSVEKGKTLEKNFQLEPDQEVLEEVVVTANRYETKKRETGQIVNVVAPKMFATTMAVNPAGVLDFQPGSRIEYNCCNCGVPQLRINGLGGEYTQVLLDSRPIFSSLSMVYGLEQLPAAMIERVETVRGGGSALFGSNAIAGTVNIITKEPTSTLVHLSNQSGLVGNQGADITTSLNASFVSYDRKSGAYVFSMIRNRDAYDYDGDGFSEMPHLKSETVGMRAYHKFSDYAKLTAEYHHIHEFRRGGDSLHKAPQLVELCEQLEHYIDGGGLNFDYEIDSNNSFNAFTSAQYINRASYFGTNYNQNAFGDTKDITVNAGVQYIHRFEKMLFMPSVFTTGVDFTWNKLHDRMLGYNRDILQNTAVGGFYAQNEWKNKHFGFLLGFRLDKHSLVEKPILSPRVTLRYAPNDSWTFRASFAQGYRAPQTYDEDLHVGAVGGEVSLIQLAEGLRAEFSNAFTFSVDYWKVVGNWQFNLLAEGFYTHLKDVFALVENGHDEKGNLLFTRVNADGAIVAGTNIEGRITNGQKFSLHAGLTYQRSLYTADFSWSDQLAPQRRMFKTPDLYGYFNLDYTPFQRLKFTVNGTYTGSMLVQHCAGYIEKDTEVETRPFWDISLRAAYPFHIGNSIASEFFVSCKNILNQFQNDPDKGMTKDSGYIYGPAMPRTFYLGISFDF